MKGKRKERGVITVFLSMILLMVISLVLMSIENARILSVESRGYEITHMALDSCFSSYAREVFERYGIMVLWKSEEEFLQDYNTYLDKNSNYRDDFKLRPSDFLAIKCISTRIEDKRMATDEQGELLEEQIYDYMRYAVAGDLAEKLLGDTVELSQSESISEFNEQLEDCNNALSNMEASVEGIYENINTIRSIEYNPEEVLTAMKQRLEEIRAIPVDEDDYNKAVRDNIFTLYKVEFRKYYEWQTKSRAAYEEMLSDTEEYCQYMDLAQDEVAGAKENLDSKRQEFTEDIFNILAGEIDDINLQLLNVDADSYHVLDNQKNAVSQKKIVDKVAGDMSDILQEMWDLDYSGNKLYIYDKEGEFIERMYTCVCNAQRDISGYQTEGLGVNYEVKKLGKTKNEIVEFVKKIKKEGVINYIVADNISDKKITNTGDLPSGQVKNYSEKNWKNIKKSETAVRRALLGQYILDKFNSYTDHVQGSIDYELEYIISGKTADRDNLVNVINKIILIREGFNFAYLMKDNQKREEAYTLAVTITGYTGMPVLIRITQLLILGAWAYAESVVDVKDLLAGYRVAVMKNSEEWNLSLGGIKKLSSESVSEENKQKRKGLTYEDYLRYLLFSQDRGEQIFRISDIIQMNMCREYNPQFRLSECMIDIEVETNYQIKRLFTEIGFLKREIYDGSKGFVIQTTQSYGY